MSKINVTPAHPPATNVEQKTNTRVGIRRGRVFFTYAFNGMWSWTYSFR